MPEQTFTTAGRGNVIASYKFPWLDNVFNVTDFNVDDIFGEILFTAAVSPGCSCTEPKTEYPPLQVAVHPYTSHIFLFRQKQIRQLMGTEFSGSECIRYPIDGLYSGIRYHVIEDIVAKRHMETTQDDPRGDHSRVPTRMPSSSTSNWFNDLYGRGYEHIYGDNPGYKSGRQITFERGKIRKGLLDLSVYKKHELSFTQLTDSNGEVYTIIRGINGIYLRDLTIYFDNVPRPHDSRFHLIFKYDVSVEGDCFAEKLRKQGIVSQEEIIDNIGLPGSDQTNSYASPTTTASPSKVLSGAIGIGQHVIIDTRYITGDYIELRGYQPKINKIIAYGLEPKDFFANALISNSFASTCDSRGRIFVFYEDHINYTELPYIDVECKPPPSSSTAQPSSSSFIAPVTSGIGIATNSGDGDSGDVGDGGGTGGIPGNDGDTTSYGESSSSSSPQDSSSSAGPPPVLSSSSSGDTIPPPPPFDGSATPVFNIDSDNSFILVDWSSPPGTVAAAEFIGTQSSSSSSQEVVKFDVEWATGDIEGPYTLLASGIEDTRYTHPICNADVTSGCAKNGEWNYYKIYAVDQAGNRSAYILVSVFVISPKPCFGRDCMGCIEAGYKSKNSYTVYFSQPSRLITSFNCSECNTSTKGGFFRILEEAFYEKARSTLEIGTYTGYGDRVPVKFCLLEKCDDVAETKDGKTVYKECTWENTFYVPAVTNDCEGFGCLNGFQKVLVPMTITLKQKETGWSLYVSVIGPDCTNSEMFKAEDIGFKCKLPDRFVSDLEPTYIPLPSTDTSKPRGANTRKDCALFTPEEFRSTTGTISCAMSPDFGETWYQFKGVIRINNDRMAVKPVVTHDVKNNIIHLFYTERDFIDDNNQLLIQGFESGRTGFDAHLKHVKFNADWFTEMDSFIPFYPAPVDPLAQVNTGAAEPNNNEHPYHTALLNDFSSSGKLIRRANQHLLVSEEFTASGGVTNTSISLVDEHGSAYVDNRGRVYYLRFGQTGTLIDPPDRLTRRRRRRAKCGRFTWTVSGILDDDCSCQSLLGSFLLEKNEKTQNYEDTKWTLSVSDDFKEWKISADNGMFIFRKKRNITQCPPTGLYRLTCNRCKGNISGTLDAEGIQLKGRDAAAIDNGDLPAQERSLTDWGNIPINTSVEHEFVVYNNRPTELVFTANPRIQIIGLDSVSFTVTQNLPESMPAYSFRSFKITFRPSTVGPKVAAVRIFNSSREESPFFFNLAGKGVPVTQNMPSSSSSSFDNSPSGIVFSADSVGKVLVSMDNGETWANDIQEFKAGQNATACYDRFSNALYVLYVTDDMLFGRRYPSLIYTKRSDLATDSDEAFDGFNIVSPPQLVLPDINGFLLEGISIATGGTALNALGGLAAFSTYFALPNVRVPGEVIDTFEQDYISKKTILKNEKDPQGLPIYLVGNREGALINGYYPYPSQYVFNDATSVALSKPAAYITSYGSVRFFYVDINGNVNGGILTADKPTLDSKRRMI